MSNLNSDRIRAHRRIRRKGRITGIEVLLVVLILGILFSIALPIYQERNIMIEVFRVMDKVEPLRMQVERHILETGSIPGLPSDVPGAVPVRVQDTAIAQLENNGVILVRFDQSLDGPLAGTTIELAPIIENDTFSWRCDQGTLPSKYRSSRCWIS